MLNERELGEYLRHATRSLFRLETLLAYGVPTDRATSAVPAGHVRSRSHS